MKSPAASPSPASSKPVLAVDIDDVLAHHYVLLSGHLADTFGHSLAPQTVDNSFFKQLGAHGIGREEVINAAEELLGSQAFYLDPIDGAIESITRLKPHYDLIIVTARPLSTQQLTIAWLERHFPAVFRDIEVVGSLRWGAGLHASKMDKFKHHQVAILLDDRLEHCKEAAEQGIRAVLFGDYGWNQMETLPSGVTRAANWPEVERLLLS
jgi:uncharacterized HAD superfamily protein